MTNPSDIVISNKSAYLITSPSDITYLTGFSFSDPHTRESIVVADTDNFHIFIPAMFTNQINQLKSNLTPHIDNQLLGLWQLVTQLLIENNYDQIYYQPDHLTAAEYLKLSKNFKHQFKSKPNTVQTLRAQKSPFEIKRIAQATQITEQIIPHLTKLLSTNLSERQLAWQIKQLLHQAGAHHIAFQPIVAYGQNTANPHHLPTDKKLTQDTLILIDWAATYHNYHSDITRMWYRGTPTDLLVKHYQSLHQIHTQLLDNLKPDTPYATLHQQTDQLLKQAGLPTMIHSLGHGVGLEIHEHPKINAKSDEQLLAYQTIALEPAFYISGTYGMRIEDLIYYDGNQTVRLTQSNDQLQIIPA